MRGSVSSSPLSGSQPASDGVPAARPDRCVGDARTAQCPSRHCDTPSPSPGRSATAKAAAGSRVFGPHQCQLGRSVEEATVSAVVVLSASSGMPSVLSDLTSAGAARPVRTSWLLVLAASASATQYARRSPHQIPAARQPTADANLSLKIVCGSKSVPRHCRMSQGSMAAIRPWQGSSCCSSNERCELSARPGDHLKPRPQLEIKSCPRIRNTKAPRQPAQGPFAVPTSNPLNHHHLISAAALGCVCV